MAPNDAVLPFLDKCEAELAAEPEAAEFYASFKNFYSRKLWHQLTLKVEEYVGHARFATPGKTDELMALYENLVKDFEAKMNKLKLAIICLAVAKQLPAEQGMAFLTGVREKDILKNEHPVSVFLGSELAMMKLTSDKAACKELIDACQKLLDSAAGWDSIIPSSFYRTVAAYHKDQGPAADFYKNALLYLSYTPVDDISVAERLTIAFDLGLAALVGEGIYNFSELLQHPLVESLKDTEFVWLGELLTAFNMGDIVKYESLVSKYSPQMEAQPALLANSVFLKEKITLMALMELVFSCMGPNQNRDITFATVAERTRLPVEEVELLLMKGMSLNLIKGIINQVEDIVTVSWVQPRVLDLAQIGQMKGRLLTWQDSVNQTLTFLDSETPELVVS